MYRYNEFDRAFLRERVLQYRDQVERRLSGALTEEEFKPLRLMNGVYLQLHAYMLRVAIPYGTLSAQQMRGLAGIAERDNASSGAAVRHCIRISNAFGQLRTIATSLLQEEGEISHDIVLKLQSLDFGSVFGRQI